MKNSMSRRAALLLGIALAGAAVSGPASAQAWPSKPIRLVVPFPPGGSADVLRASSAASSRPRSASR
jgi:tripartite-type tricarboxylate transporter receptor subunit TctC